MNSLTWPDLIIDLDAGINYRAWIEPWRWLVHGRLAARLLNRFGCWFIQRPEGPIQFIDVFYGEVETIADSFAQFQVLMNDPSWQEDYLLSDYVFRLHGAGKVAAGTQSYAITPPPLFGGPHPWTPRSLDPTAAIVLETEALQSIYAQVVRGALRSGDGTGR